MKSFSLMQTTPPFLKKEPRHIQIAASVCFYADVACFLLSFFCEGGHCLDFLDSRPDFLEIFRIEEQENGTVKVRIDGFLSDTKNAALLGDILMNFDLVVSSFYLISSYF